MFAIVYLSCYLQAVRPPPQILANTEGGWVEAQLPVNARLVKANNQWEMAPTD